jgi:uncharacterized protein
VDVFDLEGYLPGRTPPSYEEIVGSPYAELVGPAGPDRLSSPERYGFANYLTIYPAWIGEKDERPVSERTSEMIRLMDKAKVMKCVLSTGSNATTSAVIRQFPSRVLGFAHLSPFDGMRAVRELERLVREEGFSGLSVASLYDQVRASDARYYPLYAKCVELHIPVRIYTAMTLATDRPYDLGHPRELDRVAIDFPELKIIAGLAGWPWLDEMIGLLRRHPNLYVDTAARRPQLLATAGSGWEQFLELGNSLLQDKVMVGLSWRILGMTMEDVIDEYLALPLRDQVKEKWLFANARRLFDVS